VGVEDGDGQEETGGRAIRTDDVSERCSVICLTRGGPPSLVSQSLGPGFGSACCAPVVNGGVDANQPCGSGEGGMPVSSTSLDQLFAPNFMQH